MTISERESVGFWKADPYNLSASEAKAKVREFKAEAALKTTVEYWTAAPNNASESEARLQVERFKIENDINEPAEHVGVTADHERQNPTAQRYEEV
jgi:hypothetical protein